MLSEPLNDLPALSLKICMDCESLMDAVPGQIDKITHGLCHICYDERVEELERSTG